MIVDMPSTTISKIGKRLQELREAGGVVALGRVLTLIVETDLENLEAAVNAANGASKLHPSRIIVLAKDQGKGGKDRLDAEIRVGGDAGASEVVILKALGNAASNPESLVTGLMLPDAPVVAWWPSECSGNPSATALGDRLPPNNRCLLATRPYGIPAAARDQLLPWRWRHVLDADHPLAFPAGCAL